MTHPLIDKANAMQVELTAHCIDVLRDVREACFYMDDYGGIGVSEDVVIDPDLFDRICTVINTFDLMRKEPLND
jgi:hypothetical protein